MTTEASSIEKDPVCGMTVDPARAAATYEHAGKTYYFCCRGCQEKFRAEPAKYLKSGGLHVVSVLARTRAENARGYRSGSIACRADRACPGPFHSPAKVRHQPPRRPLRPFRRPPTNTPARWILRCTGRDPVIVPSVAWPLS